MRPKHWVASSAGCLDTYLFGVEFSRLFFSFLSPSNPQQKLGTRKKESIVELGKNLRVFWFWVRSLPWVLGRPSKTQCLIAKRTVLLPEDTGQRAVASGLCKEAPLVVWKQQHLSETRLGLQSCTLGYGVQDAALKHCQQR